MALSGPEACSKVSLAASNRLSFSNPAEAVARLSDDCCPEFVDAIPHRAPLGKRRRHESVEAPEPFHFPAWSRDPAAGSSALSIGVPDSPGGNKLPAGRLVKRSPLASTEQADNAAKKARAETHPRAARSKHQFACLRIGLEEQECRGKICWKSTSDATDSATRWFPSGTTTRYERNSALRGIGAHAQAEFVAAHAVQHVRLDPEGSSLRRPPRLFPCAQRSQHPFSAISLAEAQPLDTNTPSLGSLKCTKSSKIE